MEHVLGYVALASGLIIGMGAIAANTSKQQLVNLS
jgi:hypothetical protein